MGHLKRKTTTRPLPAGAEVVTRNGERTAKWRGRNGRTRTAPVSQDGTRVLEASGTWYAGWTDAAGRRRTESTGCRDKSAAAAWLAAREREAELIRAGVVTGTEARAARHADLPLSVHVADYLEALRRKGATPAYMATREHYIKRVAEVCGFYTLRDLDRDPLEDFLAGLASEGKSARTRNYVRASCVAFGNWLLQGGRVGSNPFAGVRAANERVDRRRVRRALTDAELTALLDAAERRPLHDARHGNRGKGAARLTTDTVTRLLRLGRERRLIYLTLVSTGLRRGELAAVRIADVDLEARTPCIHLPAAHEKSRRGADVPLTTDLVAELRTWIADRRTWALEDSLRAGKREPLVPHALLFDVPTQMTRTFDRDLAFAGIAKHDDRGRTVDLHGLRTTLGTRLARAGVPLQVAQRALRHSRPELTANIYTALDGGDVAAALDLAAPTAAQGDGEGNDRNTSADA